MVSPSTAQMPDVIMLDQTCTCCGQRATKLVKRNQKPWHCPGCRKCEECQGRKRSDEFGRRVARHIPPRCHACGASAGVVRRGDPHPVLGADESIEPRFCIHPCPPPFPVLFRSFGVLFGLYFVTIYYLWQTWNSMATTTT